MSRKKVRVAFIGCGGNGRGHGRRIAAEPDAEIVGFCDVNEAAIQAFREIVGIDAKVPAFTNYREMLAFLQPDAVVISTPHTLHFQQIMDSLGAGCHVLTEKPMVCTMEHARKVVARVEKAHKHVMIGYQRHFNPVYIYCRNVVQSGELGKVHFVTAYQSQNWYQGHKGKWRQDPELSGGGQLNDSGSHLLDILLWILEMRPEEIFAIMDCFDTQVDILTAMTVRFDTGALCNISVVGHAAGRMREDVTIWMENGTLFLSNKKLYREEQGTGMVEVTGEKLPKGGQKDRAFLDLILGKAENVADATNGLRVIQLTEAAWKSAKTGKPVTFA